MTSATHVLRAAAGLLLSMLLLGLGAETAAAQHATEVTVNLANRQITVASNIELWGRDPAVLRETRLRLEQDLEHVFNRDGDYRQYKCYQVVFEFLITERQLAWMGPDERAAFRLDDGRHHLVVLDVLSEPAVAAAFERVALYDATLGGPAWRAVIRNGLPRCAWYTDLQYDPECAQAVAPLIREPAVAWAGQGSYCRGGVCYSYLPAAKGVITNTPDLTAAHEVGHLIGMGHNDLLTRSDGASQGLSAGLMDGTEAPATAAVHHANLHQLLQAQNLECTWSLTQDVRFSQLGRGTCGTYERPFGVWDEEGTLEATLWSSGDQLLGTATLTPTQLDLVYECTYFSEGPGSVAAEPECSHALIPGTWHVEPATTWMASGALDGSIEVQLGLGPLVSPREAITCEYDWDAIMCMSEPMELCTCGPSVDFNAPILDELMAESVYESPTVDFSLGQSGDVDEMFDSTMPTGGFYHQDHHRPCSDGSFLDFDVTVSEPTLSSTAMRGTP